MDLSTFPERIGTATALVYDRDEKTLDEGETSVHVSVLAKVDGIEQEVTLLAVGVRGDEPEELLFSGVYRSRVCGDKDIDGDRKEYDEILDDVPFDVYEELEAPEGDRLFEELEVWLWTAWSKNPRLVQS